MAQNMNVSVTLKFVDQFTTGVRQLQQQLQSLTQGIQTFNRVAGTGNNTPFGRMQAQVRGISADVRQLTSQFQQLGRAMGAPSGGGFAQGQAAGMRQLLGLQQQALQNQARLNAGGGSGRVPNVPGGSGIWGRRGFSPNASLADRAQYRAVNMAEQSLLSGALDLDRARTNLLMLANPRRDPGNPENMLPGVISPDVVTQIEREAVALTQQFRALNRAHVLDTFKELVTQFQSPESAFKLLPQLLAVQEWQVLQGSTVEQARDGMSRLVRAMGLSGRLVDNNGQLNEAESGQFLENYLRARMIGGVDVTPDQVFQVMKYLKASGQTMNQDALLTAFIGMPDIRGSTFGNQLNQLRKSLLGTTTQAAQSAMAANGLGTIGERTQSGGHGFEPVDPVLLNENIFEWFNKHILGPEGFMRRQGLDPLSATQAQMSAAMRKIFPNQSSEAIANAIVSQQAEWRTQVENARRFNMTPEALQALAGQSTWYQLQSARSKLQDVMGSVAENFKLLLPSLESVTKQMGKIAAFMDPQIGTPLAGMGLLGAGAIAGFLTFRRAIAAMGTLTRTLLGGGLGFMLGGPAGAVTGALLVRGMGGGAAGAAAGLAAGAAGAAAGASFARRFVSGAARFFRAIPKFVLWGAVVEGVLLIIEHWETVSARLKEIWADLKMAAPTWAGGAGQGWGAIGNSQGGFGGLGRDMRNGLTSWGLLGPEHGTPYIDTPLNREFAGAPPAPGTSWWAPPAPWEVARDLWRWGTGSPAAAAPTNTVTVAAGAITINVTAPGADPSAIGAAAGNAVGSALRGALGDVPAAP